MECLFCKIINGEIPSVKIWEDERSFAFLDINPVNHGHTLIIPKKHYEDVFAMDDENYSALFKAAKMLSAPIQKAICSKRVGIVVEGFLIPHAHVHLIPINTGKEIRFNKVKPASKEELEAIASKIRKEIKQIS